MSKKRVKEISLSEKLSSLIHTKPTLAESDDEDLTTVDKIAVHENDSEYSADELDVPKFRKINNSFLDEDDSKYLGKGISRKDLKGSDDSDFDEAEDNISNDGVESNQEDDESEVTSDVDNEVSSENESDVEKSGRGENSIEKKPSSDINKQLLSKASSDIEKGRGIKNQLHLWDFLLECRMKFQNSLVASNQFPSFENFIKFKNKGGSEFNDSVAQCRKTLKHLLCSFLTIQDILLKSNEEYLNCSDDNKISETLSENEEIPSDSDNEADIPEIKSKRIKLKKLDDFSNELSKRHKSFETYRNNTIQKWNDKTRIGYISNKNFSAFEQSTLKQIEHVLVDKQRLIKRTQTKRSSYHILGEEDEPLAKTPKLNVEATTNIAESKNKDTHKEIFDDDDFYHQLLSELVKRRANDVTDPVQLGRQWMQLQKIRSKMKKTVDVKASKGRKIRFVVHPKLVNFMTPINNSFYNEDSKIELFNSLFGKNKY